MSLLIRWILSLSFTALLFFLSFDIGETWFWCSGMSCYLFSIIAVTWGMFFMLHPATHLFCYGAMSSCFLFVGGPARIWFLVTVLFSIYCCSISFYAGYHHLISSTYITVLKKGSVAIAFLILSFFIIQQLGIVRRYATAYDEREQLLTGLNQWVKSDTIIRVAPLPPPGMLYGAEITDDTSHHTNQHLRSWYKLRFHAIKN
jgi:hypothetical protein